MRSNKIIFDMQPNDNYSSMNSSRSPQIQSLILWFALFKTTTKQSCGHHIFRASQSSQQTHFHSSFPSSSASCSSREEIIMGLVDKVKAVLVNVSLEPVFFLFCVNLGLVMIPNADLYLSKVVFLSSLPTFSHKEKEK